MLDKDFKAFRSENGGRSTKKISVPYFWKGGTPGAENVWIEPQNWYNRNVPGWFDTAVISSYYCTTKEYPVITEFANDVSQLIVEKDARLTIAAMGKLCVDGLAKKGLGILNEGDIIIEGELTVHRTLFASIRNKGLLLNNGSIAIDKSIDKGIIHSHSGRFENLGEFLFL